MAVFSNESAKLVLVLLAIIATPVLSGLFAGLARRMRLLYTNPRRSSSMATRDTLSTSPCTVP